MNNKGNARDIMVIAIILFVVGIGLLVTVFTGNTVINKVKVQTTIANNSNSVTVLNNSQQAINYSDYAYLGGFIGFFISLLVFAWFVPGYPVLSIIYFILLILFGFISVIFQNVWSYIISQQAFSSTVVNIPITSYICSHLAYFMVVFGLISMTIMYSKST